jgi:hypothetical protein
MIDNQENEDMMLQKIEQINRLTQSGNEMLSTFERIMSVRRDCKMMSEKTEQIRLINQERIIKTLAQFKQNQELIERIFGERDRALSKYYQTLDAALLSNDRELIIASMQEISKVVTTSPLAEIERLSKIYDDTSQPLLDF